MKSDLFKLLCDDTRLEIFYELLKHESRCVCEIEASTQIKQANISKHLQRFKELDILTFKRERNFIRYSLSPAFLKKHKLLIDYLKGLHHV